MKYLFFVGGLSALVLVTGSTLLNAHSDDRIAHAVEVRQSVMTLLGDNFGTMAAMVQGKIPWDAKQFTNRANDLGAVTSIDLMRGYIPDSHHSGTAAKPEIWEDMEKFTEMMQSLSAESAKLAEVSKSGDSEAMKAQFMETANACKGCHEEFKNKEKN